jgi:acid phosphatase
MRAAAVAGLSLSLISIHISAASQALPSPLPFRFAIIGNSGTGAASVREFGTRLSREHAITPLDLIITTGGNVSGARPQDFARKFEDPFAQLLNAGVPFQAVLGKRDSRESPHYPSFHMNGRAYYAHRPRPDISFFALDTSLFDSTQLLWFEQELGRTPAAAWKIVQMHDPIYSSAAGHPIDARLRRAIEPILVKYRVDVVFAGRDAVYERLAPQGAVTHLVVGSTGQLDRGGLDDHSTLTARGYDQEHVAVLATVDGETMRLTALTSRGNSVDTFTIARNGR